MEAIVNLLYLFFNLLFSLFMGFVLLYIFSRFIVATSQNSSSYWDEKECEYVNKEMELNGRMVSQLYRIGKPLTPEGTYSASQMAMWETYYNMQKEYDELFQEHIRVVIYHDEGVSQ